MGGSILGTSEPTSFESMRGFELTCDSMSEGNLGRGHQCVFRRARVGWVAALSLSLASPSAAELPGRWRPYSTMDVLDRVTLRIHWYESSKALREAAEHSGQDIDEIGLHGFSVLRRNTQTGDYVCDVFVVRMTGALVDNDRTMTFGHEVLHCFGLRHE